MISSYFTTAVTTLLPSTDDAIALVVLILGGFHNIDAINMSMAKFSESS